MGFFDKLVPAIKGLQDTLFKLQGVKPGKSSDWQEHMTDADIAELEKMGCDVTELKAQQAVRNQAAEQERAELELSFAPIKLEKLDIYKQVPRSEDSEFFKDIAGKPPTLGSKEKWLNKYKNTEIVYASIVQANSDLWEPGEGEYLPAVIVYTNDKTLRYDIDFLKRMAEKVNELQEIASADVPDDCKEFIKTLQDQQSIFFEKIGKSVTGEVDVWCETFSFPYQTDLPNSRLPPNGIIPLLMDSERALDLIPGKYYI